MDSVHWYSAIMVAGRQFDLIYNYTLIVGKTGLQLRDNISTEKNPMHKPVDLKIVLSPY